MPEKQKTITLHVNGQKTKVGIQPINVVVVGATCDEKAVSDEQEGSCDERDADGS
jgi:hypothetical protein